MYRSLLAAIDRYKDSKGNRKASCSLSISSAKSCGSSTATSAFTIVELLIVIVVIAILAVLVIVSYSAIQNNARNSTLQADLSSSYNVLANDYTTTASYPATLAAANNGIGITPTSGNTYSYSVNNSASPAYYCLSETNTATGTTYYVTSTSNTAQSGGCVVTNLVTNPNFESNITGWSNYFSTTKVQDLTVAHSGSASLKLTTVSNSQANGAYFLQSAVVANGTYTISAWVDAPSGVVLNLKARTYASDGPGSVTVTGNSTWQRLSLTVAITSNPTSLGLEVITIAPFPPIGTTFWVDDAMLTQGSNLYTYADGSSTGWSWTGTANASTSTGPPL